ncbi:MAG TPA: transcription antitermination factor NusB [Egibacteraceae bacterium]|nr:transcription antitermination factor NusB [Egibacteraceae bacterium]
MTPQPRDAKPAPGSAPGAGAEAPKEGLATRRAAYRALRRIRERQAYSPPVVQRALDTLPPRERGLAANLVYETLRWQGTLDWALGQVLTRPIGEVEDDLRDILRMGAWQLLYGRMPDRAVVDTSVALARGEVGERVAGFTNGVLRNLARRKDALPWPPTDDPRGLALATGSPVWVAERAIARFGARAEAVLRASAVAPGLTLRAVARDGEDPGAVRDALVAELRAAGVDASAGRWAPEAVRAPGADPMALDAVRQGRATPQDESSMLVTRALARALEEAGGGDRVADLCAGPGGKATHLAQLGLRVTATDVQDARAAMVAEQAVRLGLSERVDALVRDARSPDLSAATFDAVLVDAPCSGLGVTRRRPEVAWRREPEDPARLSGLQLEILGAAAALVRPGGVLLYSVCTWPAEETAGTAAGFLAVEGDRFTALDPATLLPEGAGTRLPGDPGVQLDPDHDGTDGMYVCGFRRLRG